MTAAVDYFSTLVGIESVPEVFVTGNCSRHQKTCAPLLTFKSRLI
jgi:hypothetical protein